MGEAASERTWTMRDYIEQTPGVLRGNICRRHELTAPLMACCPSAPDRIRLVASGSSYNAACCALPFMRSVLGDACRVEVITPHRFTYYEPKVEEGELVAVVTQSGLSTNALQALDAVRAQGARAVCLTGNAGSDARDHADATVDFGVGEELVGYVTKGVGALALFLMLFSLELAGREERLGDIEAAVDAADAVRQASYGFFDRHEKELTSLGPCYCCAPYGASGVAAEAALKIGETVHVPSFAYEVEEFIHGPNLQLTPAYTAFFFDAGDAASERTRLIWRACREVTDRAFIVTAAASLAADSNALVSPIAPPPDTASLAYLPFAQLLSYLASSALGSTKQHPLLRRFKAIAAAKTESFVNYDGDD